MFPVGIVIATIAMTAGIGGAVMFVPFFMLVLKVDTLIALATGLVIEVFGFSSGVIGYWRKRVVRFDIVKQVVVLTVPAAVAGVMLGRVVPVSFLRVLLALLLLYLAYQFLLRGKECIPKDPRCTGVNVTANEIALPRTVKGATFLGGMLLGMISAGLGEVNEYNFLRKMRLPVPTASGTSVFLIAMSAIVGVFFHVLFLFREGEIAVFSDIASLVVFTVPGVIVGAQIGVALSKAVNARVMGRLVGVLFLLLGALTSAIAL